MTPRIDPLIGELVSGSKTADAGVKNAMQKALYEVVSKVGANMNEASRASILALIDEDDTTSDDTAAITNARLLGALIKNLAPETATSLLKSRVLTPTHPTRASVLALNSILLESPTTLTTAYTTETITTITRAMSPSPPDQQISDSAVLAAGKYLLTTSSPKTYDVLKPLFESLATSVTPGTPVDTRRLALVVLRTVSRHSNDLVRPHVALLAPPVFSAVRDPVIPVKLAAEAAFLALFGVVEEEGAVFEKYLASSAGIALNPTTKRSMQDYFRRVALRLAGLARERREAEGGQGGLGLAGDEVEDEREVWSVGRVEVGEGVAFE